MAKSVPNLKGLKQIIQGWKYRASQTRWTQTDPNWDISKLKWQKLEDSKGSKRKRVSYKGIPIRLATDFPTEVLQARKEWQDILKVLKEKFILSNWLSTCEREPHAGEGRRAGWRPREELMPYFISIGCQWAEFLLSQVRSFSVVLRPAADWMRLTHVWMAIYLTQSPLI